MILIKKSQMKHKKSLFTKDEDQLLTQLFSELDGDWVLISQRMFNRNRRQCRERWNKLLNPEINRNPWSNEEDELLEEKFGIYGNKWKDIALFFDKRTYIDVRNRHRKLDRRKKREIRKYNRKAHFEVRKASEFEYRECFKLSECVSSVIENYETYDIDLVDFDEQ